MGLLSKLFGLDSAKQIVLEIKELSISELDSFLNSEIKNQTQKLLNSIKPKFNEISSIISDMNSMLSVIKSKPLQLDEGNIRLRKVVKTTKNDFIIQMSKLCQKLFPPQADDFSKLTDYCLFSSQFIQQEVIVFRKNIVYTSMILKQEVKQIGEYLQELLKIFSYLENEVSSSSIQNLKKAQSELNNLQSILQEKNFISNSIPTLNSEIKNLSLQKTVSQNQLSELKNSEEAKELDSLLNKTESLLKEKQNLKSQFFSTIFPIEKPLSRFISLAESGKYPLSKEEKEILSDYLNSNLDNLNEEKIKTFKSLLPQLKDLINSNQISLKWKEIQKRLSSIDSISEFDFNILLSKYSTLQLEFDTVSGKLNSSSFNLKLESIKSKISSVEHSLEEKSNELNSQKTKLITKKSEMISLKQNLENLLENTLKTKITIVINKS